MCTKPFNINKFYILLMERIYEFRKIFRKISNYPLRAITGWFL
jgi:hypothetical protein